MKLVIAFVQPFMVEKVMQALQKIDGLSGASIGQVRGFGRGRGPAVPATRREEMLGTSDKARVEAMIPARIPIKNGVIALCRAPTGWPAR